MSYGFSIMRYILKSISLSLMWAELLCLCVKFCFCHLRVCEHNPSFIQIRLTCNERKAEKPQNDWQLSRLFIYLSIPAPLLIFHLYLHGKLLNLQSTEPVIYHKLKSICYLPKSWKLQVAQVRAGVVMKSHPLGLFSPMAKHYRDKHFF